MLNLSGKQHAYLQSTTAFVIFCAACSMLHVLEVWNSCQIIETRFAINLKVWYTLEKYIQQHYARRTCLIIIKTIFQIKLLLDKCTKRKGTCIWVKSRRCNWTVLSCYLVCYQLIAKPGNKTVAPPWLASVTERLLQSYCAVYNNVLYCAAKHRESQIVSTLLLR